MTHKTRTSGFDTAQRLVVGHHRNTPALDMLRNKARQARLDTKLQTLDDLSDNLWNVLDVLGSVRKLRIFNVNALLRALRALRVNGSKEYDRLSAQLEKLQDAEIRAIRRTGR